jgi:hypothetical protein
MCLSHAAVLSFVAVLCLLHRIFASIPVLCAILCFYLPKSAPSLPQHAESYK